MALEALVSKETKKPSGLMRRFAAPAAGYSFKSFVICELTATQEVAAAAAAERRLKGDQKSAFSVLMKAQLHENARLSLVRVDDVDVWDRGVEYHEFDKWNKKSREFLITAVNQLSPIDEDAEKKALADAEDFAFDGSNSSASGSAPHGTSVE